MKRQTMANLAKDMDTWIEKRDQLSHKIDELKKQKDLILKSGVCTSVYDNKCCMKYLVNNKGIACTFYVGVLGQWSVIALIRNCPRFFFIIIIILSMLKMAIVGSADCLWCHCSFAGFPLIK